MYWAKLQAMTQIIPVRRMKNQLRRRAIGDAGNPGQTRCRQEADAGPTEAVSGAGRIAGSMGRASGARSTVLAVRPAGLPCSVAHGALRGQTAAGFGTLRRRVPMGPRCFVSYLFGACTLAYATTWTGDRHVYSPLPGERECRPRAYVMFPGEPRTGEAHLRKALGHAGAPGDVPKTAP